MALTVRPDDEVYQFDTVWLGPDEYTLPIQARYVAWGTWLACFMVAAVLLIPFGGSGPAGVLGSLIWALGLSVVLSRAVMLVVDHERPLRSLPALFSAEARSVLQARRRGERSLLVRPGKIRVRETPPKVLAMRERQRSRAAAKAGRKHRKDTGAEVVVAAEPATVAEPARSAGSAGSAGSAESAEPASGWRARRTPAWSIRADEHDVYEPAPVPVLLEEDLEDGEVHGFVRAPDPETEPQHARPAVPEAAPQVVAAGRVATPPGAGAAAPEPEVAVAGTSPFRVDPHEAEPTPSIAARLNATVPDSALRHGTPPADAGGSWSNGSWSNGSGPNGSGPDGSRSNWSPSNGSPSNGSWSNGSWSNGSGSNGSPSNGSGSNGDREAYRGPLTVRPDGPTPRPKDEQSDPDAALEARILLPARKDR